MANIKKWYQSKTLWTGVIVVLGATGDALINGLGWRQVAVIAFGALITYLRTVTTTGIAK